MCTLSNRTMFLESISKPLGGRAHELLIFGLNCTDQRMLVDCCLGKWGRYQGSFEVAQPLRSAATSRRAAHTQVIHHLTVQHIIHKQFPNSPRAAPIQPGSQAPEGRQRPRRRLLHVPFRDDIAVGPSLRHLPQRRPAAVVQQQQQQRWHGGRWTARCRVWKALAAW